MLQQVLAGQRAAEGRLAEAEALSCKAVTLDPLFLPPYQNLARVLFALRRDSGARLLLRDGQTVPLAPKAFDLLCFLLAHPHRLIGKDELLKGVWPRGFVEEGNLSHNIFLLRRALGESPEEHRYIVTVPGRGYKFVGHGRGTGARRLDRCARRRSARAGLFHHRR